MHAVTTQTEIRRNVLAATLSALDEKHIPLWRNRRGWFWADTRKPWTMCQDPVRGPFATQYEAAVDASKAVRPFVSAA